MTQRMAEHVHRKPATQSFSKITTNVQVTLGSNSEEHLTKNYSTGKLSHSCSSCCNTHQASKLQRRRPDCYRMSHRTWFRRTLLVIVILLSSLSLLAQATTLDQGQQVNAVQQTEGALIQSTQLVNDEEEEFQGIKIESPSGGTGVSDTIAIAGQIFTLQIPLDAFSGYINTMQIHEAGEDHLPPWLSFNSTARVLFGVPLAQDIGIVYLSIDIYLDEDIWATQQHIFTIDVQTPSPFLFDGSQASLLSLSSLSTICPGQYSALEYCNASQFPRYCPSNTSILFASIAVDFSISAFNPLRRVELTVAASRLLHTCPDQLFVQHSSLSALPQAVAQSSLNSNNHASTTIVSLLASCVPSHEGSELIVPNSLYQSLETILGSEVVLAKSNFTVISWSIHSGSLPWSFISEPRRLRRSTTASNVNSDLENGSGSGIDTGSGSGTGSGDISDIISIPMSSLNPTSPTLTLSSSLEFFIQSTSEFSITFTPTLSQPQSSVFSSVELLTTSLLIQTTEPIETSISLSVVFPTTDDILLPETTLSFPTETSVVDSTDIIEFTTEIVEPTTEITDIVEPTTEITDIVEPTTEITDIVEPTTEITDIVEPTTEVTDIVEPTTEVTDIVEPTTEITDIIEPTTDIFIQPSPSFSLFPTSVQESLVPSPSITIVPVLSSFPETSPVLTTTGGNILTPISEPVSDTAFLATSQDIDIFTSSIEIEPTDSFFLPSETSVMSLETEDIFTVTTPSLDSSPMLIFTTSIEDSTTPFPSISIVASTSFIAITTDIFPSLSIEIEPSITPVPSPSPVSTMTDSGVLTPFSEPVSDTEFPTTSQDIDVVTSDLEATDSFFPSPSETEDFFTMDVMTTIMPSITTDVIFTTSVEESFMPSPTPSITIVPPPPFPPPPPPSASQPESSPTLQISSSEEFFFTLSVTELPSPTPSDDIFTMSTLVFSETPSFAPEPSFIETDMLMPMSSAELLETSDISVVMPTPFSSFVDESSDFVIPSTTSDLFFSTFTSSLTSQSAIESSTMEISFTEFDSTFMLSASENTSFLIPFTETLVPSSILVESSEAPFSTDVMSIALTPFTQTETIEFFSTLMFTLPTESTDIDFTTDMLLPTPSSTVPTFSVFDDSSSMLPTPDVTDMTIDLLSSLELTEDVFTTTGIIVSPTETFAVETTSADIASSTEIFSLTVSDVEFTDTIDIEPTDTIIVEPTDIESSDIISTTSIFTEQTETILVEPTDTIFIEPTDTISAEPTDTIFIEPTDTISVEPSDTISVEPSDTIFIEPTDTIFVEPTDTISVEPTGIPSIELSETIFLESSDAILISPSQESISFFFTDVTSFEFSTQLPSFGFSSIASTSILLTPSPSPSSNPQSLDVVNPIGILFLNEGELFSIQIPEDTFYDPEDGLTSNLSLSLLHIDEQTVESTSWVQLVEDPHTLRALPLSSEVEGGVVTNYQFLLLAEDSDGNNITSSLTLRIIPQFGIQASNFVTVFVEGNFAQFAENFTTRFVLSQGIANPDPSSIYFKEFRNGSIAVTYTNTSIASHDCPAFYTWFNTIYTESNYTSLYTTKIAPFVPISRPILTGPCVKVAVSFSALPPTDGTILPQPFSLVTILLAIIVPMVALACLLLLLGGLACVLYRRRSKREKAGGITFKGRFPAMLPGEVEEVPYRYRAPTLLTDELPRRENRRRGYLHLLHSSPPRQPVINSLDEENDEELVDLPIITLQTRRPRRNPPEYRLPLLDD